MSGEVFKGVDAVEWHWLRKHHERDALWTVVQEIDLNAVAEALAQDDAARVRQWLEDGQLAKPSETQLTTWNSDPTRKLRMAIVQPFVLTQEIPEQE